MGNKTNIYVNVIYDKFENKTTTTMKESSFLYGGFGSSFKLKLRYVSMPAGDILVLDINYDGDDWFFLRQGELIININNVENMVLRPKESYTDTYTNYHDVHCVESDYYELTQEQLKRICDAQTIDFKISGAQEAKIFQANHFIMYAQKFYNALYDSNAYEIKSHRGVPQGRIASKGCWITVITVIILVAIFILLPLFFMFIMPALAH